jgi:hypothetical protein
MTEQVHHVSFFSVFAEEDGSTVATSADAIGCEEIHVKIAQDLEFTSGRYFYISHGIEFDISIVVLCLQTDNGTGMEPHTVQPPGRQEPWIYGPHLPSSSERADC